MVKLKLLTGEVIIQQHLLDDEETVLDQKLRELSKYISVLDEDYVSLQNLLEYIKVSNSYASTGEGKIMTIIGWYPKNIEDILLTSLEEFNITFLSAEASKEDRVPIILRNNSYTRLFEPITKIFQLPNYHEFDLTPLVAVFYPIFFAYCLGDAGYGLIFMQM